MVRKTELRYWNDITLDHMSEESSNTEVILIHNLLGDLKVGFTIMYLNHLF